MQTFIVKRLIYSVFCIIGATLIAFFAIRMAPGDPLLMMAGERQVDARVLEMQREHYGLNKPIIVQVFSSRQIPRGPSIQHGGSDSQRRKR